MLHELIAQISEQALGGQNHFAAVLGYLGMAMGLASYLMRSHRALCAVVTAALVLMSAHFWLIGANTVAALTLFAAARWATARAIVSAGPAARWAATVFVAAATCTIAAFTWSAWSSVLPAIGSFVIIVVHYHLKDHQVRRGLLLAEFFWAATAVTVGSTPGLVLALAGMVINTVVMVSSASSASSAFRHPGPTGGLGHAGQSRGGSGHVVHSMHSAQAGV